MIFKVFLGREKVSKRNPPPKKPSVWREKINGLDERGSYFVHTIPKLQIIDKPISNIGFDSPDSLSSVDRWKTSEQFYQNRIVWAKIRNKDSK